MQSWGGLECSVNRVGECFGDQLGDGDRPILPADLEVLAGLNLDALRFPILWERVSPNPDGQPDWNWTDAGLEVLRAHCIRPIAGLLHHGSGPRHTSLLDPGFADGLAEHAARVAERYPWIIEWTPVNEPLTTARFSALYGLWYPHERCEERFWTALLNQIDATRLAMRAIRGVQPGAKLIQTEDLGRTYATAGLFDQAAYDNQRRWMTWDLLCGWVDARHPLWPRLCGLGLEHRLRAIAEDPCPPDVIGINHYLTSDRMLDERTGNYPGLAAGGNGRQPYCDIEAVRVLSPGPQGVAGAIDEAWRRYGRPIALTEVHNGCTREEQVRWFDEAWNAARAASARGVAIVAVAAWSLFGSRGWSTLLTAPGAYEPGAFDTRGGTLRPTALAAAIRNRSRRGEGPAGTGWWRRDIRLVHPPAPRPARMSAHAVVKSFATRAPILITGATGTLGQALAAHCRHRDIACVLTARDELDLLDPATIDRAIARHRPWAAINAAGWVRVDEAEENPAGCSAVNAAGAVALAARCAAAGIGTVNFSSDLVFDGTRTGPYVENDPPNPRCVYGRSKHDMERALDALAGNHLVIRTAAFFSPHDSHNFAHRCFGALRRGEAFAATTDHVVSPTYVPDLCRNVLDLLIDGERGVWHLTNGEALSWFEFALRLADRAGMDRSLVQARRGGEPGWRAPRLRYSALTSLRGMVMPSLESAIASFVAGASTHACPADPSTMRQGAL